MAKPCELANRTRIRAFRVNQQVLIVAEGELPTPGFDVDITQSPLTIFPPQFNLLRCPKPGVVPEVVTPYRYAETVRFPHDQSQITVHHAEGADQVQVEEDGEDFSGYVQAIHGSADRACPDDAEEAVGLSPAMSFDEAFANAIANLSPSTAPYPDALARIEVLEIGGLFGGFAGFHHMFVRVCRSIT